MLLLYLQGKYNKREKLKSLYLGLTRETKIEGPALALRVV